MRIKEIADDNRPRERLKAFGKEALSDPELLAIIIQNGTKSENVIDLCNRIISTLGLEALSGCSLSELSKFRGIGEAKAMQIAAAFEISRRALIKGKAKRYIKCAKDVFNAFQYELGSRKQEEVHLLCLDCSNRIIEKKKIFVGTLNESIIHPREIFKEAVKNSSHGIILVHNHPSGRCFPSEEDEKVTEMLSEAGKIIGIRFLDHVIICDESYYSFRENNKV
ncbi:MAG TPA: JAB domain-containing protein [Candidatus Woesearchaeota archaeon]|nr:JAB domain-containing protein [Candidatus Woesearchaeota archaeon]